jgi:hypothetical protein
MVARRSHREDEAGRAQFRMRGAGRRQPLLPFPLRVGGQPPLERRVRRRHLPGFLQDPQRAGLAGRLDDPREHQLPEDLVAARGVVQAQDPVAPAGRVQQAAHPRGGNRQRPGRPGIVQAEAWFQLAGRDPLPGGGLQRLQLSVVVRRPDVLDVPRTAPRGQHDLHRGGARLRLHRPYVRHPLTLRTCARPRGPDSALRGQRDDAASAPS